MALIKLIRRPSASDEVTTRFLKESRDLINAFDKVYDFLSTDMKSVDTEENQEMGISWDYAVLFHLDDMLSQVQLQTLNQAVQNMWFAEGSATTKLNRGIIVLGGFYQNVAKHISTGTAFEFQNLNILRQHIQYALGDFIYALQQTCGMVEGMDTILSGETFMVEAPINQFLSQTGMSIVDFFKWMFDMRRKYVSVIPIFREDPVAWSTFIANLEPSVVEILEDYGDWIYPMDIAAVSSKQLVIDDNYLDLLQSRCDNSSSTANMYPDEWWAFQRKIPAELAGRALELEPVLSIGAIDPILNGDTVTTAFFDAVEKFGVDISGSTPENYMSEQAGNGSDKGPVKTHKFGD